MERHEVETLLTLAEELHFGRTAERLHVTTARVSQVIKQLERRVGVPLFDRTSRRVSLTPVGRQLVDDVRPAHERLQAALARAINAGKGVDGVLRVGFVGAAAGQLLLRAEEIFRERHPGCTVEMRETHLGDATAGLRSGEIDVMLGCLPVSDPGLVMGPVLLTEPWMLAVPARHPFARQAELSIEDMAGDKLLQAPCALPHYWDDPGSTPGGRRLQPGPRAETFQEILTLVGAGKGIFAVGAHVARFHQRPDVAYVPFHDTPVLEWGLMWPATGATARVQAFTEAALRAEVLQLGTN
jgi:DNA-binding transcriptional LysR family regulator